MGCMCTKSNIIIKPKETIEPNEEISNKLINSKSKIENLNENIKNNSNKKNQNKIKLNEYSIIEIPNPNLNIDNINNKKINNDEEKENKEINTIIESKISSSYNIIELISMEKSSHKTEIIQKNLIKTYIPSSFKLKNEEFEKKIYTLNQNNKNNNGSSPSMNFFKSETNNNLTILNQEKEKINLIFFSDYKEKMTEVWFNQGDQIKFLIKNNIKWGIKEKGFCDYKGYEEIYNNSKLCCLLMRIGEEKNYVSVDCNETYYSQKNGPLFLKMNISLNYLKENNFHLEGMLHIEILNGIRLNSFQIFRNCGFEGNLKDFEKNEIVYTINLLRKNPIKFCQIFFPCDDLLNYCIKDNGVLKENNNLIINDVLTYISKFLIDNKIEEITESEINFIKNTLNNKDDYIINLINKFSNEWFKNKIKEFVLKLDNLIPLDIIKKLIEKNYIKYILDKDYNYIGVTVKEEDNSHLSKDYFMCSILISKNYL